MTRQFTGKCKKPAVFKTQNSIKERPRCNISSGDETLCGMLDITSQTK